MMRDATEGIEHEHVLLNGCRTHLARAGAGELLVLLHGFPECWYSWRHVMTGLAPHFRVVAPDCRGYHLSEKTLDREAYRTEALCRDLLALLQHEGAQRCVLVGHDWGGMLAWQFAARYPQHVSRLVILNAPHPQCFQWALDHDPRSARHRSTLPACARRNARRGSVRTTASPCGRWRLATWNGVAWWTPTTRRSTCKAGGKRVR
jgi:pimeloyl-ACP methyl ester carboxylesterase